MSARLSAEGLKKLEALRKQRAHDPLRLTGENKPDIAYFNMGHGGEINNENKMKIIPKGCIFVLKAKPGRVSGFDKSLLKERLCEPKNQSLFLDPIKNYKRLNDMFDTRPVTEQKLSAEMDTSKTSLAVYREYDTYPETHCDLLNVIPSVEETETGESEHNYYQSGFLNSSDLSKCRKRPEKPIKNKNLTIDFIASLYEGSFFPGEDYVKRILKAGIKNKSYQGKPLWYKIHSIMRNDKYNHIYQSEIFKMVEEGTHGFKPGVYYNLACRYTGGDFLNKDYSITEKSLEPIRKDGKITFKPEIEKQLLEAEGHRRNLISRLNLTGTETKRINPNNYKINYGLLKGLSGNELKKKYNTLKANQNAKKNNNTRKITEYYKKHSASHLNRVNEPTTKYKKINGKWVVNNSPSTNENPSTPKPNNSSANENPNTPEPNKSTVPLIPETNSTNNKKNKIIEIIHSIDSMIERIDKKK